VPLFLGRNEFYLFSFDLDIRRQIYERAVKIVSCALLIPQTAVAIGLFVLNSIAAILLDRYNERIEKLPDEIPVGKFSKKSSILRHTCLLHHRAPKTHPQCHRAAVMSPPTPTPFY
jgi:hypothetical protein